MTTAAPTLPTARREPELLGPAPIDHVLVTAGGMYCARLPEMYFAMARRAVDDRLLLSLQVGREAAGAMRSPGSLVFMGGVHARRPGPGLSIAAIIAAALSALIANLALELAPVRVNLIAAGFVDTPQSASLPGDQLDPRRNQLRSALPIRHVVEPADVAARAVHS